jgi:CheY-specific phosphatase CheX
LKLKTLRFWPWAPANPNGKADYINPFLASTRSVLETMAQTPVTALKPRLKPRLKDISTTYGEVTGIIGMVAEKIAGSMIVGFSEDCILKIVANMLMEQPKERIDAEKSMPSVSSPI